MLRRSRFGRRRFGGDGRLRGTDRGGRGACPLLMPVHSRLLEGDLVHDRVFVNLLELGMFLQPDVALAAITATPTPVAEVIRAGVLGAVNADRDGRFAADAAHEREGRGH
jgi:hypothetical protein